jgi:hypothetical protein
MLVPIKDQCNDWGSRKPLLEMMLERKLIQPQDVVVINQVGTAFNAQLDTWLFDTMVRECMILFVNCLLCE